jgi:hypothetical protein
MKNEKSSNDNNITDRSGSEQTFSLSVPTVYLVLLSSHNSAAIEYFNRSGGGAGNNEDKVRKEKLPALGKTNFEADEKRKAHVKLHNFVNYP